MRALLSPLLLLAAASAAVAEQAAAREAIDGAQSQECTSSAGECTALDDNVVSPSTATSVYVIGDLHGDAICAVSWVNRTGLIANLIMDDDDGDDDDTKAEAKASSSRPALYERLNHPSLWEWNDPDSKLVFMGDYVDKGPTSRQTVEFVRDLTTAFPESVTAILGNHELELLRDREEEAPHHRYGAYSYATIHPGEYHNYFGPKRGKDDDGADADSENASGVDDSRVLSEKADDHNKQQKPRALDEEDDLVLDLLYEAGMEVYAHSAHSAVRFVSSLPEHTDSHRKRGIMYAITDLIPPQHRVLARERLAGYIDAYMDSFRTGTELGDWMERRPVVHLNEDIKTLFVHGGVSEIIGKSYLAKGREGVEKINSVFFEHNSEGDLHNFLSSSDDVFGYVVYELLTYRGNHPGYSKWESHGTYEDPTDDDVVCKTLHEMLSNMDGIDRIAVGHTPDDEVRILCGGAFLALDSTLGRWIRGSGNEYCPGPEHLENRRVLGVHVHRTSRDGKYRCDEIKEVCEGQIVRLDSDGSVNVMTM